MTGNFILNNATKTLTQLQSDLDQYTAHLDALATTTTTGVATPASAFPFSAAGQIHSNLESLRQASKDMSDIAKREITTVKREKALARANQMQADYQRLKTLNDTLRKRQQEMSDERDRIELMGSKQYSGFGASGGLGRRAGHSVGSKNSDSSLTDTSTILMMDGLLRENQVLSATDGKLDEFIQMGQHALTELMEQRHILKATQKRMYDIATSLGLSASVIKYIEKRATQDRWVLFGG
ncbi:protein transport protein bos1, partial [Physocladia obscura]